jgi:hypothetical protein
MESGPYSAQPILHITKRGGRGLPIVKDDADRYRFLKCLYFLNDANHPTPWERDVDAISAGLHFERPDSWPGDREPYVDILSYCLVENHFHILLQEREEGGAGAYLQSLSNSLTQHFNSRYGGKDSIFGGRPDRRMVESERYLLYAFVYLNIKNTFEMVADSIEQATADFDTYFTQAMEYQFSSLPDVMGKRSSPIIVREIFADAFASPAEFRNFARDQMARYRAFLAEFEDMM